LTSITERVNGALAEELTGDPRAHRHLESLAASNTFVVGLGPDGGWYRYHALLQQMLRHRLTVEMAEIVPDVHRRAAHWFAAHGQPIEALHHAADAEDWGLLGHLVVTHALPLSVSVDRAALDLALARIPTQRWAETPELALAAATRLMYAGRFEVMEPHLARAREQMSTSKSKVNPGTRVGHLLLSAAPSRSRGDNDAVIQSAARALDELSGEGLTMPAAAGYRAAALSNLGTGLLWSGRLADAEKHLVDGLGEAEGTTLDATRVNILAHLALVEALSGRLRTAHARASHATGIVHERGWAPLPQAATAYLALGLVHLQRNDIVEGLAVLAEGQIVTATDRAPHSALGLLQVRISASTGQIDTARSQLLRLHRRLGDWKPPQLLARWSKIVEAEVDLAAGDPTAALKLVEDGELPTRKSLRAPERLVQAQALLKTGDAHRAEQTVAPLRDPGLAIGFTVEAWIVTALAANRLRDDRRANEAMLKALLAAEPEEIRSPFVARKDEHLPRLLDRVKALHPRSRPFIQNLEAAPDRQARPSPGAEQAISLTDRELSVLQYLPSLMTYTEIAAHLYVSVNTLKSHIRNIYAKLGVVNRRQAVHRAVELGLVDE
jgi:LuxR family transcriptional regulator, maltose regulon positive regulatory protein